MNDDWRLTNQMDYLYRSTLLKAQYRKAETNDHDHCEFCWGKFGVDENSLHDGFCTVDRYRWICKSCFADFKDLFQWRIIDENDTPQST